MSWSVVTPHARLRTQTRTITPTRTHTHTHTHAQWPWSMLNYTKNNNYDVRLANSAEGVRVVTKSSMALGNHQTTKVRRKNTNYEETIATLREHVWENQNICASRSLRFRSNFAGRFALGCRSTFQSPHKIFWREPWNWHTPQYWPNIGTIYGSTNEPRHSVQEQATNKTPSSHHYLTLEEFLGQHHLATPASQKTREIIPWRHKWSSWK